MNKSQPTLDLELAPSLTCPLLSKYISIYYQTANKTYLWDNLQPSAKQTVKDGVLSVMIDSDRNIRRAAANIVAAICCIEIPRNEWDGIV